MVHLLTLAVINPGQGKAPPGAAKLTTILQWTAWGVFALCVAGVLISAAKLAHSHQQGYGGAQPAHHQPGVDARGVRDRRLRRSDRRRPQLRGTQSAAMNDQPSQREAPAERVPWSRPSVLLSVAFVLALALLGVVLALIGGGSGHQPGVAPPSTTTAASAPPHASRPGGCSLPAGQQDIPSSSPPPVRWGTVGSMQVPQNPAVFGPGRVSGPWNTCFAHDPSGALLAAMNLWAEGTAVPANELFARLAVGAPRVAADVGIPVAEVEGDVVDRRLSPRSSSSTRRRCR